jgi:hypothetical protein
MHNKIDDEEEHDEDDESFNCFAAPANGFILSGSKPKLNINPI